MAAAFQLGSVPSPTDGRSPRVCLRDGGWIVLLLQVASLCAHAQSAPPANDAPGDAEWVAEVRERSNWWSLQSLRVRRPVTATARDAAWSRDSIDAFLREKLHSVGLTPARAAEPAVLMRRATIVLTGLPPTLPQQERFREYWEADATTAYERYVDELLASPHLGERFARHWMDVVRYTDTYGYESDNPANGSWEYRDYLIRVFNRDLPYDQFVREQLAGDLLPEPRIDRDLQLNESAIGPMFFHLGEHREGGSLMFNGIHQQMVDNKIDAFSKAFLAHTVACARCHDHKLEPISQRDYYELAAVFMTPRWTSRVIDMPGKNDAAVSTLRELRREIQRELAVRWRAVAEDPTALSLESLQQAVANQGTADAKADSKAADKLTADDVAFPVSKLVSASGDVPSSWNELAKQWRETRMQRLASKNDFQVIADFRQPVAPDGWVIEGEGMSQGYVEEGTPLIALDGDLVVAQLLPRGFHTHALSSKLPGALRSPPQHSVPGNRMSLALAGGEFSGYLVVQENGFKSEEIGFLKSARPVWKTFSDPTLKNGVGQVTVEFATTALNPNFPPRIGLAGGLPPTDPGFDKRSWLSVTAIVTHDKDATPQDTLEHFQSLYEQDAPGSVDEAAQRLRQWLVGAVQRWCDGKPKEGDLRLLDWLLAKDLLPRRADAGSRLAELVAEYRRVEQTIPFPRTVTGMDERQRKRSSYPINVRGDVDAPGEPVTPAFTRVLADRNAVAQSSGSGRLELAEALLRPDHPLTSRVYVNRVWQWIFGQGIVTTPDDFGHLGDQPSHPELLDALAQEFVRDGWSTKQFVRRLVLSEAFRQSGATSPAGRQRDPANRLLHHYPTRRLEAEAIRDAMLAVSGRLDRALYGRPINPFRLAEDKTNKRLFSGPLDGYGRRSLYSQFSIMEPPKFLVGFNLPDLKLPAGKRDVTNVPTQALTMLNDPLVNELAHVWSSALVRASHDSVDARLTEMFELAFAREPTRAELDRWGSAVRSFAVDGQEIMRDEAAWKRVAHMFFNAKEFIYYR